MYYPYLRGKLYELKAIKEFSNENPNCEDVIPIIEPVNQSLNALSGAIDESFQNRFKFALILNPNDGDYRHSTVTFNIIEHNDALLKNQDSWIPAYLFRNNPAELTKVINESQLDKVMLIFKTCVDTDDPAIMSLIANDKVEYLVNDFGSVISRRVRSLLEKTGKKVICLEDCFVDRKRNADYLSTEDEPFSEMFAYYKDEGFNGFSDYTTLSRDYSEGGMLPYALAIHLTYQRSEDQIYIHHFVSDSNSDQSNIKGKFKEASSKIRPFYAKREMTPSVVELIQRAENSEGYPGLGYIKKLSINNHLELVKRLISK